MNANETTVQVSAAYHLKVAVGDTVRQGDAICEAPEAHEPTASISGVVKSIQFDPQQHEFVIVIARAT